MVFGLYQNFGLSRFCLIFSFYKVGSLTAINQVANHAVAIKLALSLVGICCRLSTHYSF